MKAVKPQLDALTGVRFFAAFHVVVYHHAGLLDVLVPESLPFLSHYLHTGYTGVNLFFVLSGFILAYTYCEPGRDASVDPARFWVARFARIYPVYLLGLLLVSPFVLSHFFSNNDALSAVAKIGVSGTAAATLLQSWIPPLVGIWNAPGWTLSVEAFFYALFPFLIPALWRMSARRALVGAGVAWGVGLVPPLVHLHLLNPELPVVPAHGLGTVDTFEGLLGTLPIFRLPEFVFGICLARAFFPQPGRAAREARRLGALAMAAALAIFVALALADHLPRRLVVAGLLDPLYGALIVGLAGGRGPLGALLSTRIVKVLGEASYALYILHIPIRMWMGHALDRPIEEVGPLFFAVYAPVTIGLATLTFFVLEDRARRWIRRLGR